MSSIENGLRILALLTDERPSLRVGEVGRDLDIPKASVSRLLKSLADAGLLERDDRDGTYYVAKGRLILPAVLRPPHPHGADRTVRSTGW